MPFEPVSPEKLSRGVVRQIELLILRGILRPGERLPSERELSERMGVSRPSLREALAELQEAGLLASRAGSGVFVADVLGSAFSPALVRLFSAHDEAVSDSIAFRRDMEGMAVERAAQVGSDTDLKVINAIFGQMQKAHARRDDEKETAFDAEFHLSIMEASHNVIMLHMMRSMYDLLRGGVFYNRQMIFRQPDTRQKLFDQHAAINDALQARDGAGARRAVEAHFDFVEETLQAERKMVRNEAIAAKRLEHATDR